MFKKLVFIGVLVSIFLSGIFFMFAQENTGRPSPDRRRYDHEFDRLSQEERRRLHSRGNAEFDRSMQRSRQRIRDDSGAERVRYRRSQGSAAPETSNERGSSRRESVRKQAREYLRKTNPEMSERELDELIESMLDQLIRQLEARIAKRTRLRLKRQLVSFLTRLIKKYKVDPSTAEEMTRERARRELENIKRNGDRTRFNNDRNAKRSNEPEGRNERTEKRTENRTPRASQAKRRKHVRVKNRKKRIAQKRAARRRVARRRAAARRRANRKPVYILKRFVVGNDKNGIIIKKSSPKLVTVTVHTNSKAGDYCYAVFTAVSLNGKKKYKIHVTRKFLMLDYRTQYQFYWGGTMHKSSKSVPDGRYRIYAYVAVHNSRGKVIARPGRYWGGKSARMSVETKNGKKTEKKKEDKPST